MHAWANTHSWCPLWLGFEPRLSWLLAQPGVLLLANLSWFLPVLASRWTELWFVMTSSQISSHTILTVYFVSMLLHDSDSVLRVSTITEILTVKNSPSGQNSVTHIRISNIKGISVGGRGSYIQYKGYLCGWYLCGWVGLSFAYRWDRMLWTIKVSPNSESNQRNLVQYTIRHRFNQ